MQDGNLTGMKWTREEVGEHGERLFSSHLGRSKLLPPLSFCKTEMTPLPKIGHLLPTKKKGANFECK